MNKNHINTSRQFLFIDALIVLLNLAAGRGNYLLFGLTGINKSPWITAIVIIIDIIYIFVRRIRVNRSKIKESPFVIIFILLSYNMFNMFFHGETIVSMFELIILWSLFYIILYRLSFTLHSNHSCTLSEGVLCISRGYVWLSMLSIIGVVATFLALTLGYVDGGVRITPDFMEANIETGANYYWTFLSVLNSDTIIRLPFFQEYGFLTGLFHEPHVLTLNIFPCLILLLGVIENRIIPIVITGILIMLFSGSATNIIVTAVCSLLFVVVKFRQSPIVSVSTISIVLILVVLFLEYSDGTFLAFLDGRLDGSNSSSKYTSVVIEHTFIPHTFFGTNFLSTSYVDEFRNIDMSQDIGFIPWALNIVFLFLFFKNIFLLIIKNNKVSMAVGFASLYFILHSAKGGMTVFYQPLLALLIFLQLYVLNYNGAVRNIERNTSH